MGMGVRWWCVVVVAPANNGQATLFFFLCLFLVGSFQQVNSTANEKNLAAQPSASEWSQRPSTQAGSGQQQAKHHYKCVLVQRLQRKRSGIYSSITRCGHWRPRYRLGGVGSVDARLHTDIH